MLLLCQDTKNLPVHMDTAGVDLAVIAGPFAAALAHGSSRSSSPLPLENSTDSAGKLPVLTQRFPARNQTAFKSSLDFPFSEDQAVTDGQNSSPGASLTSPSTVGDKVCVTCGSCVPRGGGRKEPLSPGSLFSPSKIRNALASFA